MSKKNTTLHGSFFQIEVESPLQYASMVGGRPHISFYWKPGKNGNKKRRLIGNPNKPTRVLHELFGWYVRRGIDAMGKDNYTLRRLPSSTGFVKGSNPLKNAQKHIEGRFFYTTDIWSAYPHVDLKRLAALLVYIKKHQEYKTDFSLYMLGQNASCVETLTRDPLYEDMFAFLESFCSGLRGEGLAVGGPLSPYFFNLFCEVFADARLRKICERYDITCTRFADDCVFSRNKPIIPDMRRDIRAAIQSAGFSINHRKSHVLAREMGTVFITKVGLREPADGGKVTLVHPQKKRRKLHEIVRSYLLRQMDWPEKVSGYIPEFLYYYKNVGEPTATDHKTFALCKKFETEWARLGHRTHR